jgi:hypothetical protein
VNINRGLLFWGLALITAGAVALLVQQDVIDRGIFSDWWRLWPLILNVIGRAIILARTPFAVVGTVLAAVLLGVAGGALVTTGVSINCGGNLPTDLQTQKGSFTGSDASVLLDFNCGRLDVSTVSGSDWEARTGVTGNRDIRLSSDADSLTIRSPEGGFGWNEGRQRWEVDLGSEVTYDLDINGNAADGTFDLAGGSFSRLNIDPNAISMTVILDGASVSDFGLSMNAGSAKFRTDADTDLAGSIDMNAGSIDFCTAPGAAVRFRVDANITFSHNLDDSNLGRSGDTWRSDNFEGADHVIDLTLSGNAASFTLNPQGGCS